MWSVRSRRSEFSTVVTIQRREAPCWFGSCPVGRPNLVGRPGVRRAARLLPGAARPDPLSAARRRRGRWCDPRRHRRRGPPVRRRPAVSARARAGARAQQADRRRPGRRPAPWRRAGAAVRRSQERRSDVPGRQVRPGSAVDSPRTARQDSTARRRTAGSRWATCLARTSSRAAAAVASSSDDSPTRRPRPGSSRNRSAARRSTIASAWSWSYGRPGREVGTAVPFRRLHARPLRGSRARPACTAVRIRASDGPPGGAGRCGRPSP